MDKISVVITTVNREDEVNRAIKSVINQTYKNIEIIVVIDGKNSKLKESLEKKFSYNRLVVIETKINIGGSAARNVGIRKAKGEFVALLDDDDEWVEKKLEKQIKIVKQKKVDYVVFNSVYDLKRQVEPKVRPSKKYNENEDISEFLFRYRLGKSIGFVQTSTLFAKKEIFIKHPFDENLRKHQDWDWVVMANYNNIKFYHISEPLTIYHNEKSENRVGKTIDFVLTKNWLQKVEGVLESREFDRIIYTVLLPLIVKDDSLEENEKKKLIKEFISKVKLRNKYSITYLKFYILYKNKYIRKLKAIIRSE